MVCNRESSDSVEGDYSETTKYLLEDFDFVPHLVCRSFLIEKDSSLIDRPRGYPGSVI
jgi:hypothetical protein